MCKVPLLRRVRVDAPGVGEGPIGADDDRAAYVTEICVADGKHVGDVGDVGVGPS